MGLSEESRRMRRVQKRADRRDGWTEAKKDRFIETLEATCNIAAALRAVEMSRSGLNGLRARDGEFRARMREARRAAYVDLEFFTLDKIMNGTVKTVTKADGKVETVHEYPLALALQLLRLHRDVAEGGGGAVAEAAAEPSEEQRVEVVERILRKLRKLRARLDREDAAKAASAEGSAEGEGSEGASPGRPEEGGGK